MLPTKAARVTGVSIKPRVKPKAEPVDRTAIFIVARETGDSRIQMNASIINDLLVSSPLSPVSQAN